MCAAKAPKLPKKRASNDNEQASCDEADGNSRLIATTDSRDDTGSPVRGDDGDVDGVVSVLVMMMRQLGCFVFAAMRRKWVGASGQLRNVV
jgi:hypothetical protein